MPPPSPRDVRQQQRSCRSATIAQNCSLDFTSLEDCDRRMLKECMRGKRMSSEGSEVGGDSAAAGPGHTSNTAAAQDRGNNGESHQNEDKAILSHVATRQERSGSRSSGEARQEEGAQERSGSRGSSGEARRESDERHALTETLQRGGLLRTASAPQQALFASGANLLKRPRTSSRASSKDQRSHTSSSMEQVTGVADADNGRHSRVSGSGLHRAVKLTRIASSASHEPPCGRSSSLHGGRSSSYASLAPFFSSNGSLVGSSSGSFSAARCMRDMETPPGGPDALEAHKVLVRCPPPLRSFVHATRRDDPPRGLSPVGPRAAWELSAWDIPTALRHFHGP